MNNKTLKRILPTMLITTLLLTGCNKTKEACNVKDPHLHLYQKEISSSQVLSSYFNSEEEDYQGFTKTDDIKLMDEYDQASLTIALQPPTVLHGEVDDTIHLGLLA